MFALKLTLKKILIIRFSSIGDLVLTTPVIRCVKNQVDGVEVHYVCKERFSEVLEHNPHIDKHFYLENSLKALLSELKKENYDLIIDLHNNIRTRVLSSRLGVKRITFHKLNYEKWLLVNFNIYKLPHISIVDRYFNALHAIDVNNDNQGLEYHINPNDVVDVNTLPPEFKSGYIGFVIGAAHYTKKLPVNKIISVINKLNKPVVLLGGKEDANNAEKIISESKISIYNACGKYTIGQSASLVKQAESIITHDTGLMHIAAAYNKKIISVWGNTIPEFGMYPYFKNGDGDSTMLQVNELSCRPCSKIGYPRCPK
ncbi:MAG: glycosyltransferase family 9 protein, partial [Bacteroidia bacterium]|nr:glycosyltransferase family 9 protein [Bacteroidia bacterium]